jgi:hypothetical protein
MKLLQITILSILLFTSTLLGKTERYETVIVPVSLAENEASDSRELLLPKQIPDSHLVRTENKETNINLKTAQLHSAAFLSDEYGSWIKRLRASPRQKFTLKERFSLFLSNIPSLLFAGLSLVFLYISRKRPYAEVIQKGGLTLLILMPFLVRAHSSYAYDLPLGLLCNLGDLVVLSIGFHVMGGWLSRKRDPLRMFHGIAFLTLLAVGLSLLGIQSLLRLPSPLLHGISTIGGLLWVWTRKGPLFRKITRLEIGLVLFVFASIFPRHLLLPAPPDADLTSMASMIGILFQGNYLDNAPLSPFGDFVSIRYPAGLPGLSWFLANFINVRASESLLLLWQTTFLLLPLSLIWLNRQFRVPWWLTLMLCFNTSFLGPGGWDGGQVNEFLTLSLSVIGLVLLIRNKTSLALLSISAALLIQPMVTVPFLFAGGVYILKFRLFLKNFLVKCIPFLLAGIYLFWVTIFQQTHSSTPEKFLKSLTTDQFFSNLQQLLNREMTDRFIYTGGSGSSEPEWAVLLLAVFGVWLLLLIRKTVKPYWILSILMLGELLLAGCFKGYFRGSSNMIIPLLIVGVGTMYVAFKSLLSVQLRQNERVIKKTLMGLIIVFWLIWLVPDKEYWIPRSFVFTTHSNIRLGRWIEMNTDPNIVLANVDLYEYQNNWNFGFMARGDTSRHVLHERFRGFHLNSRSMRLDENRARDCIMKPQKYGWGICYKKLGATHLLISAHPLSDKMFRGTNNPSLMKVKKSYLIKL